MLLEEQTAVTAFERAAELTGIFDRHSHIRRDVILIDTRGKGNIPMFQKVLNHFQIPYTVIHDEDKGNPNPTGEPLNPIIESLLPADHGQNIKYMISPTDIEALLGYSAGKDKPYQALKRIEELHAGNAFPPVFIEALNFVYFGQGAEPSTI